MYYYYVIITMYINAIPSPHIAARRICIEVLSKYSDNSAKAGSDSLRTPLESIPTARHAPALM